MRLMIDAISRIHAAPRIPFKPNFWNLEGPDQPSQEKASESVGNRELWKIDAKLKTGINYF